MSQAFYLFGKQGRIIQGEYNGWVVEMIDDTQGETGGYYILINDGKIVSPEGYDWWLEKEENIPLFIDDMDWVIEWPK